MNSSGTKRRFFQVRRSGSANLTIQQSDLGQTKVGQLEMTTSVNEQVVRLDVTDC
jgi:hypothetical protein